MRASWARRKANGRLRSGYEPTAVREFTTAVRERCSSACYPRGLVAVRIEHQPWNIYVLTGRRWPSSRRARRARCHGDPWTSGNTRCTAALKFRTERPIAFARSVQRTRRCARTGKRASVRHRKLNCFGAPPPVLFCGPRRACRNGRIWMYLQTVMLLLRRGVAQLPQMACRRFARRRGESYHADGAHPFLWHVDRVRGHT